MCLLIGSTASVTLEMYNISKEITLLIDLFVLVYTFIFYYNQIIFRKNLKYLKENSNQNSKVIIDEYGITDISNEIEIKYKIEKITHIIIGKYSINIIIDELFQLYFPIEIKNKLVKTITKYNKNIKIIELK